MEVLYFGPIAARGKSSIGGYEAANRKNIDKLTQLGVDVVEFPNPVISKKWGGFSKLSYVKMFLTPVRLLKYRARKEIIIHITPLYRSLLYPSAFTVYIAHKLNIPCLVDLRAGSFMDCYIRGNFLYKKSVLLMLNNASFIAVEGSSYIEQIRRLIKVDTPIHYFPNLAYCNDIHYNNKKSETINLFYFGRITHNKGIDILVNLMEALDGRFRLYLAGNIANDVDSNLLKRDNIIYLGTLTPDKLKEQLSRMHLFVFPTRHPGEGQSNSLIEAMASGLVPVVSDQGFNKEVIGDCGRILPQGASYEDYRKVILQLADEDLYSLGCKCQDRIKKCHNIDVEIPKLIQFYRKKLCQ